MRSIANKFLSLYVLLRYPKIPKDNRYFIRDNYAARIYQYKYFLKDYLLRSKYKTISFNGEFQQELTFALPFAYWHHLNGTLKKTVSSKYTKSLYFFSENHEETYENRDWKTNYEIEIPNVAHNVDFDYSKWAPVPLKAHYKNDIFIYKKPSLIIANRYNIEWGRPPISFFSIPMLDFMIKHLKDKYQIIYNRPGADKITNDNSEIQDLGEKQWIKEKYPEVILLNDIFDAHKKEVGNFNELQLMVYANADKFISIHGGTATLASYFGGTNIIYSKEGREHFFNEFNTLFPKLSGANIIHTKAEEELKEAIIKHY